MGQGTFSVGIPWKYGKKKGKYQVKPLYKDLKEEVLSYKDIDHDEYVYIMDKAKQYSKTAIAKSTKSRILSRTSIRMNDLICIIMYCDYTELSRDFTLSFRKLHQFEILQQIKRRNAAYYHWSKGLRDVIKHFGQSYDKKNGLLSKLKGPFFCGMSVILKIPQCRFEIFIQSPISTSKQLAVAVKFAGDRGMLLEMNNKDDECRGMQGMDVSWISRFSEEEERLFYGCRHGTLGEHANWPLQIVSIRTVSTATNYKTIMQIIAEFAFVFAGGDADDREIITSEKVMSTKAAASIMKDLLYDRKKFQPFIYESLQQLLDTKIKIETDPEELQLWHESCLNSIFNGKGFKICFHGKKEDILEHEMREYHIIDDGEYFFLDNGDKTNIYKLDFLKSFKNLISISIVSQYGDEYWPFSFISLQSIFTSTTIREIEITGHHVDESSWLSSLWGKQKVSLQQAYQRMGYTIDFDKTDFGSTHRIWIQPITSVITGLGAVLSGEHSGNLGESTVSIVNHLLSKEVKDKFPSSIYESFQKFLDMETSIEISIAALNKQPFINSLFGEGKLKKYYFDDEVSLEEEEKKYDIIDNYVVPKDNTNFLKSTFLSSFKNLKSIIIRSVQSSEREYWPFSLLSFLPICNSMSIGEITIIGRYIFGVSHEDGSSWLSSMWKEKKALLQQAYENIGYIIEFDKLSQEYCHRILIQSIMGLIEAFDKALSGKMISEHLRKSAGSIMNHLLKNKTKDRFSSSIYESFQSFLDKKTEIKIKMDQLYENVDHGFLDSIFGEGGFKRYSGNNDINNEHQFVVPRDDTNILSLDLLTSFTNLESMAIENVQNDKGRYSPFSLSSLLPILDSTSIKKVNISGQKAQGGTSWLSFTWKIHKSLLEDSYAKKGLHISFVDNLDMDCVSICKI